jgi:hypothetical protein
MAVTGLPYQSTFYRGMATAASGTIIAVGIPPMGNPGGEGILDTGVKGAYYAHLTSVYYTTGTTAHTITIMRPLNYTTVSADAAINQAVINVTADPGLYSTNYKYPLANGKTAPANLADNAIAANDWVAYQLVDGTWVFDFVASVSTLAITMTTNIPNVTGGGVKKGALFYWFGILTDSNPLDGFVHPNVVSTASTAKEQLFKDAIVGGLQTYNPGDPLIIQSSNVTSVGSFQGISGFYAKV